MHGIHNYKHVRWVEDADAYGEACAARDVKCMQWGSRAPIVLHAFNALH